HPLIKEFKRGVWAISSGYTWAEALDRINRKIEIDAVRRASLALGQAIKQGGDRTSQLEGIAEDAQRVYYTSLDKRLAALPVKAVLVTLMLMIAYFMIILAPAAVQISGVVNG
ncbi:MAG: type II secretion system F family protein, partial [Bdellovibrionales bacterium]|nr:type II secretion system F family protein [Bdellovibrionales bacterium]